jgi:lysozyme family protein
MADFNIAVQITMDDDHEGGFQKMHGDKGNWTGGEVGVGELRGTKYGISAAQFPNLDIQSLTKDQAAAIYKEGYWKDLYSQIDDQPLANKLFDMGVLFGVHTAVRMLQISIQNKIAVVSDGVFGQQTLDTLNQLGSPLPGYKTTLIQHIVNVVTNNPDEAQFSAGWIRRINS